MLYLNFSLISSEFKKVIKIVQNVPKSYLNI